MSVLSQILSSLEAIHQAITVMSIDPKIRWGSAKECAAMLGVSPYTFRNDVATRPDFPAPNRPTGPNGDPRWNLGEVAEWATKNRDRLKRKAA